MPSSNSITPASASDLTSLIQLWSDVSHQEFAAYIGKANIDFFLNSGELAAETKRLLHNTFICKRQNELAGFVVIIDDLIELLIVRKKFQNKLAGKQLYNFAIDHILQSHQHVKTECFAKNLRIRPILKRLGFQETSHYIDELGFQTIRLIKH